MMKKLPLLAVAVERITWEGIDIPVSLDAEWFAQWLKDQPELDFSLEEPITGTIRLERHDNSILVRGHLQGALTFACSRCLDAFALPLATTFDLLIKAGRPPLAEPDLELNYDDLDHEYFQGDELDLNPLLREQILLALPLQPLCREECRGLCRQCGANLNREPCTCTEPAGQSPFAVLQKIKND